MPNENGNNGNARLELLLAKEKQVHEALAAERMKLAKREKRLAERERSIIGAAVVKAAAAFPDFRLMIAQTALANVSDASERRFLADRGWLEQGR